MTDRSSIPRASTAVGLENKAPPNGDQTRRQTGGPGLLASDCPSPGASNQSDAIRRAYELGYRVDEEGALWSPRGRKLKTYLNARRPYQRVSFRLPEGKNTKFDLHRFVAYQSFGEAALRPGIYARHIDGHPPNCRPDNITIGTARDNSMDRQQPARRAQALKAAKARRRLTDEQVREIVRLRTSGTKGAALAERFGVRASTVSEILSGKLYSEVTGIAQRPRTRRDVPAHLEPLLVGGESC